MTRPALALAHRELVRVTRQPARVVASIATPVLVWAVLASGLARAIPAVPAQDTPAPVSLAVYLSIGTAVMTAVFSSIFAAMSLIEDRQEGFLQGVLVSPAPTASIVAGKLLGAGLIAWAQSAAVLLAAVLMLGVPTPLGLPVALLALALLCAGITGLGLAAAWAVNSTSGFHGVMNALLMPMLLLSGAMFPLRGAAPWMTAAMQLNPLTWPSALIRGALGVSADLPHWAAWAGSGAFAALGVCLAAAVIARGRNR